MHRAYIILVAIVCFSSLFLAVSWYKPTMVKRHYSFDYGGNTCDVNIEYPDHSFDNARNDTYATIVETESALFPVIAKELRTCKEEQKLSSDEYVKLILRFVQSLAYSPHTTYYPHEVIELGKGDCDDKSILLAGILKEEGFSSAMILVDIPGQGYTHAGAGILSPNGAQYYDGYEFLETVDYFPAGYTMYWYEQPVPLLNCTKKDEFKPYIIPISDGVTFQSGIEEDIELATFCNGADIIETAGMTINSVKASTL